MNTVSIVVPVLNESTLIAPFLRHLHERAPDAEIIVADGGSNDGTVEIARSLCDRLLETTRGRAVQMNAGAGVATGNVLWFLHVDSEIPREAIARIEHALQDPNTVGGFFRIRLPGKTLVYRLTDVFSHYAGLLLRIRCGDHGFFCRRDVFERIGGFPDVALMEDADFFRKLRRAGKMAVIQQPIIVSARRYELIGPARLTVAFGLIAVLYFLRVPRPLLETIYRRTCCRS